MLPVRTEIEVLPGDEQAGPDEQVIVTSKGKVKTNPQRPLVLGWTVRETISIAVVNTRGVSKGKKSVIVGS
jgi:hypothetical protein